MYNKELEELIDAALADGVLTEKEKQVLFKKAKEMDVDLDEFEIVLNARLTKLKKQKPQRFIARSKKSGVRTKGFRKILRLLPWILLIIAVIMEWISLFGEMGLFGLLLITVLTLGVGGYIAYLLTILIDNMIDYCHDAVDNIKDNYHDTVGDIKDYFRDILKD